MMRFLQIGNECRKEDESYCEEIWVSINKGVGVVKIF
jgi:hypothetical protein